MTPPYNERRRHTRLTVRMPVVLRGTDAAGRDFFERAEVVSIDQRGGRARTRFFLRVGEEVTLQAPEEEKAKRMRVVWRGEPGDFYEGLIGLEFVEAEESWNLESLRVRWESEKF
jgi:hypothetical protein